MMTGYMQIPHGRDSELSVGADGGVHDLSQVKYDSLYGLITPIENYIPIKPTKDEVGDAMGVVLSVVVIGMLTFGVGAAVGLPAITATTSVGGAVLIGAATGAIGGVISGLINDNLSFNGVFQSALAGGLFAGVSQLEPVKDLNNLGLDRFGNVTSYAQRAISITGQATLRGALQELVGGRFRDGFTQGIAQGLAAEIGRAINADIATREGRGEVTAEEATNLRRLSGYTSAALRALGNPGDPLHAFAQEFMGQLLGTPEVPGAGNNKPVDAETQQDITWMRQAIDAGYDDTAAEFFNNIVERRAAANQAVSRADIANQLIRELGISPAGNPSLVIAPDGNMIQLSMPSLADSTAGLAAMSDTNFNRLVEGMIQAGDREGLAALYATTRGDANAGLTVAQVGAAQGISQGALSQGLRAEMIRQRAQDAGYDIETFPMAPRPDSPLLPGTTITARDWRDLVNVNPIEWPDWAKDILVRIRSTGQLVERYTSTPGQQLVQTARDWFILQATGSSTPNPNSNIRPHAGLRGTGDGMGGTWERSPMRSGGVEYQEQISRVERGLEYYVDGVAFDGCDASRNVLLDSKDWQNYPPAGAQFWEPGVINEATRQLDAARTIGARVEWVVATESAAAALRTLFANPLKPINIEVVVVPKR